MMHLKNYSGKYFLKERLPKNKRRRKRKEKKEKGKLGGVSGSVEQHAKGRRPRGGDLPSLARAIFKEPRRPARTVHCHSLFSVSQAGAASADTTQIRFSVQHRLSVMRHIE